VTLFSFLLGFLFFSILFYFMFGENKKILVLRSKCRIFHGGIRASHPIHATDATLALIRMLQWHFTTPNSWPILYCGSSTVTILNEFTRKSMWFLLLLWSCHCHVTQQIDTTSCQFLKNIWHSLLIFCFSFVWFVLFCWLCL